MRPEFFELQPAPAPLFIESKQIPPLFETLGKIGMEFGRNLAAAALRFKDAGNGDELFAYSRISSV